MRALWLRGKLFPEPLSGAVILEYVAMGGEYCKVVGACPNENLLKMVLERIVHVGGCTCVSISVYICALSNLLPPTGDPLAIFWFSIRGGCLRLAYIVGLDSRDTAVVFDLGAGPTQVVSQPNFEDLILLPGGGWIL